MLYDCGFTDTKSHGLNGKWLDRAYWFLEKATQLGKIPGAAILVARHGIPMEPRCFGQMRPKTDSSTIGFCLLGSSGPGETK